MVWGVELGEGFAGSGGEGAVKGVGLGGGEGGAELGLDGLEDGVEGGGPGSGFDGGGEAASTATVMSDGEVSEEGEAGEGEKHFGRPAQAVAGVVADAVKAGGSEFCGGGAEDGARDRAAAEGEAAGEETGGEAGERSGDEAAEDGGGSFVEAAVGNEGFCKAGAEGDGFAGFEAVEGEELGKGGGFIGV